MTKEELLKESGRIIDKNNRLVDEDKRIRKEFAKAFGWSSLKGMYGGESEASNPSWEEVFIKTGELLATDINSEVTDKLKMTIDHTNDLEHRLQELNKKT